MQEEELHSIIKQAPREMASGPDGFIGVFFSSCWHIIRDDLMRAVRHFMDMNQQNLHMLNQAFIVLIPKKDCQKGIRLQAN
jgi:hypothetical protein